MPTVLRIPVPPVVSRTARRARDLRRRAAAAVRTAALARPRLTRAALIAAIPVAWVAIAAFAWFTYDVTHTLPGRKEAVSYTHLTLPTNREV